MMVSDAYLAGVGRSVGIPEMWLEDYAQEARLAHWLRGSGYRRTAIDFVRIFGPRSRFGTDRQTVSIDGLSFVSLDHADLSNRIVDLERAWPLLGKRQREAIVKSVTRRPMDENDWHNTGLARRKLKSLTA